MMVSWRDGRSGWSRVKQMEWKELYLTGGSGNFRALGVSDTAGIPRGANVAIAVELRVVRK
jgi:hypothetical protein